MSCIVTVPPPSSAPVPRLRPQRSRSWRSCSTSRNNPDHSSVIIKAPHLLMRGFLMGGGKRTGRPKKNFAIDLHNSIAGLTSRVRANTAADLKQRPNTCCHSAISTNPTNYVCRPYFPLDRQRISSPPRLSKTADFIPQTPIRQKPRLPRPSFSSPSPEDFRNIR